MQIRQILADLRKTAYRVLQISRKILFLPPPQEALMVEEVEWNLSMGMSFSLSFSLSTLPPHLLCMDGSLSLCEPEDEIPQADSFMERLFNVAPSSMQPRGGAEFVST